MRILITGSEGGIGRYAVSRLRIEGHQLRTLDVVDTVRSGNEDHLTGDLRDLTLMRRAVQGMDAVVHLGAIASDIEGGADQVLSVNVQGTWNVLLACVEANVGRVIAFSSVNALGNVGGLRPSAYLPIDDTYPHHPLSPYQLSKHLGEEMCRSFSDRYGMTTLCLRPVLVALPEHHYLSWRMLEQTKLVEQHKLDYWAYVDVRDVCDAIVRSLALAGVQHDAFLLSANDTSVDVPTVDLVNLYYRDSPWAGIAMESYVASNQHRSLIDCSHAQKILGWHPQQSWRADTV